VAINSVLGNLLRCLTKDYSLSWEQFIPQQEFIYKENKNRTIGLILFQLVYVTHPIGVMELRGLLTHENINAHANDFFWSMKEVYDWVKHTLMEANKKL
jgi:hypothetical protein